MLACRGAVNEHKRYPSVKKRQVRGRSSERKTNGWDFQGVVRVLLDHGADPAAHESPTTDDGPALPSLVTVLASAGDLGRAISADLRAHARSVL